MAVNPQKQAAKKFVQYWTFNRPGSEKSGCQQYWNMLLGELLGMGDLNRMGTDHLCGWNKLMFCLCF